MRKAGRGATARDRWTMILVCQGVVLDKLVLKRPRLIGVVAYARHIVITEICAVRVGKALRNDHVGIAASSRAPVASAANPECSQCAMAAGYAVAKAFARGRMVELFPALPLRPVAAQRPRDSIRPKVSPCVGTLPFRATMTRRSAIRAIS